MNRAAATVAYVARSMVTRGPRQTLARLVEPDWNKPVGLGRATIHAALSGRPPQEFFGRSPHAYATTKMYAERVDTLKVVGSFYGTVGLTMAVGLAVTSKVVSNSSPEGQRPNSAG